MKASELPADRNYRAGKNFRGVDFRGVTHDLWSYKSADLRESTWDGCSARCVTFDRVEAEGASFRDLDGRNTTWRGADLRDAVFEGADLSNAVFEGADLTGADLTNANLAGAELNGSTLDGADLTDATLEGAELPPLAPGAKGLEDTDVDTRRRAPAEVVEVARDLTRRMRARGS